MTNYSYTLCGSRLNQVLVAAGDLRQGSFRASDKVSALVQGNQLVLVRDRVTVREVPDAEGE